MLKSTSSPSFINNGLKVVIECQECGCICSSCSYSNSLDLHHEIEELRSKLNQSKTHMVQMERDFQQSREYSENQVDKLQDELLKLRDRYERLLETYKKTQKINHDLEDKLLSVVQNYETEKSRLQQDLNTLNTQLQDAKYSISDLEDECERYRSDCSVAAQLLQCKPSTFVAHKLNTLPLDLQQRVKCHLTKEEQITMEDAPTNGGTTQETKTIRVHMPTFPPTAMVYSVNKNSASPEDGGAPTGDKVPMDLIAKVLKPSGPSRRLRHYYVCSRCKQGISTAEQAVQTVQSSHVDPNGFARPATANFRTNPPTIVPHYPGVHRPRNNSSGSDIM